MIPNIKPFTQFNVIQCGKSEGSASLLPSVLSVFHSMRFSVFLEKTISFTNSENNHVFLKKNKTNQHTHTHSHTQTTGGSSLNLFSAFDSLLLYIYEVLTAESLEPGWTVEH